MSWAPFLPDPQYASGSRGPAPSAGDREPIVLAFVCIAYVATTEGFSDPARAVAWAGLGAVVLALTAGRGVWAAWGLVAAGLALGIAGRPLAVANHHFVLTWASLAMALSLSAPPDQRRVLVRHNVRWMLVAIMGFATLHKLLSEDFMNGSFLAFGLSAGAFGEPLLGFCRSCADVVSQNEHALGAFRTVVPDSGAAIMLAPPVPHLVTVARLFGISILLVEAGLFALFLLAPRRAATHLLVLAFATTLAVIRQELVFISVIVALGYLACPEGLTRLKRAYLVAAVVFTGLAIY